MSTEDQQCVTRNTQAVRGVGLAIRLLLAVDLLLTLSVGVGLYTMHSLRTEVDSVCELVQTSSAAILSMQEIAQQGQKIIAKMSNSDVYPSEVLEAVEKNQQDIDVIERWIEQRGETAPRDVLEAVESLRAEVREWKR